MNSHFDLLKQIMAVKLDNKYNKANHNRPMQKAALGWTPYAALRPPVLAALGCKMETDYDPKSFTYLAISIFSLYLLTWNGYKLYQLSANGIKTTATISSSYSEHGGVAECPLIKGRFGQKLNTFCKFHFLDIGKSQRIMVRFINTVPAGTIYSYWHVPRTDIHMLNKIDPFCNPLFLAIIGFLGFIVSGLITHRAINAES